MNFEATKIECTLDANDARIIVYALKDSIENSVKTHWVKHHIDEWKSDANVKCQLNMMKQLFRILGSGDLYDHYYDQFSGYISKANEASL